jgi:hypothetical protein
MRKTLYRWLCGLGLGVSLVGCGVLDDGSEPNPPPGSSPVPEAPRWAEGNPARGNTNTVRLRALAAPGVNVDFFAGGASSNCLGPADQTVKADEQGLAAAEFQVADNSTTYFRIRARNNSGSVSNCWTAHVYMEDSQPPRAPQWASNLPARSNSNTITLAVAVDRGVRLSLFGSGDCTGEVLGTAETGDADGTVTFPVTVLDDTTNTFTVSAADDVGNTRCSAAFTFVEDSTSPPVPVLSSTDPASPSRLTNPSFQGTAEPGASVLLYTTEQCSGEAAKSAAADAQGRFRIQLSVGSDEMTTVRARARDASGNLSGCSEALAYVNDQIAPAEPSFQRFEPAPPANDNTPLLIGTSEPGTRVWIYAGTFCRGEPVASAMTDSRGIFQAGLSVPDDVSLGFSAAAEDPAGNVGWCNVAGPGYVEDSTAPVVPSNVSLSPSGTGNANSVSISGSAVGDAFALLFRSPDCQGEPVDRDTVTLGVFTLSTTVPDDSTTLLSIAMRDSAGNTSACAGPWTFVEDSTPPSHAGVIVTDGPAEDLSYQLVGDTVESHWEGFSDDQGLGSYEHFLSVRSGCSGGGVSASSFPQEPRVRLDNLGLAEGTYFHCVRALDRAGNTTAWVASNGFRVDLQPPFVASTLPTQGETEADLATPIRLTFSEPVNSSTVTSSTFTVRIGGAPMAGTVACESASVCAFTPAGPLPYRESVEVSLSAPVTDLAGRTLASAYTLRFTTRGRQWSAHPAPVSPARPGLFPDIAMDGQGRAAAVWVQGTGDTFRPYTAAYTPYVGWDTPRELGPLGPGEAEEPAVAMNAAGKAVAVFVLSNGTGADLYAAEYAPGDGWSAPQSLESRTEAVSAPRVAVDEAGNALVVWRQSDGTAESVWAARLRMGVGWSSPLLLETGTGTVSAPTLAALGSGAAWAAWTQQDAVGPARVLASRFTPETGWAPPELAADNATEALVAVALSLDGSAMIVFRRQLEADPASPAAFATRYVPGVGWSATAPLLGPALARAEEVSVAMDRWGRALAAWTGPAVQGSQTVHLWRFVPEEGWTRVDVTAGIAGQAMVAADGQDNFHMLWVQNFAGNDRIMQLRYPQGSIAPGAPRPLEPEHSGTSKRPRVVANPAGGAAAVWFRDNGTGFSGNLVYSSLYQ